MADLDWKIYVNDENSYSVYYDCPEEGYWFSDRNKAEQFRLTLANPDTDPMTAYWKLVK